MIDVLTSLAAISAAYVLGSIPFGLLIARWFGKVDIRTVGSGNIGATNVGRVLGFRFFVVVFLLDFLKGFLPTFYWPDLARQATGLRLFDLPVLVAVAAILGHNFPVFLRFRGGKGVATSLGAVFALDTFASVASATGFATFLLVTRYVSMSSILGGLAWLIVHFAREPKPWARDQIAMTVASIGLMGLLVVRHRKNLARIGAGTEPKIHLRKKKDRGRPSGRVATALVASLAIVAGATAFALNASRKFEVVAGPYRVAEVARVATGHQRAERLAFADHGKLLAATCPRYGRVMLYRVTDSDGLDLVRDIELEGRPVALGATSDRLFVLVRPNNDARHVEEGWWESFDFAGKPVGSRVRAGFYPDDLALSPDGRLALVLTSGRGEGGDHRPMPSLTIYDLASSIENPRVVSRLAFDRPRDDPSRLAISVDGSMAAVSLQGSNAVAWVDLADLDHPRLVARRSWSSSSSPDAIRFDHRGGLLAVDEAAEALWHQAGPDAEPDTRPIDGGIGDVVEIPGRPDYWALTLPFDSGIALMRAGRGSDGLLSRLPIKGRANLASTRPLGLAADLERGLLAVANRSGGSIHLVTLHQAEPAR
jgi:acyl-phosphate glycerol 3-phosphate acyltransferase